MKAAMAGNSMSPPQNRGEGAIPRAHPGHFLHATGKKLPRLRDVIPRKDGRIELACGDQIGKGRTSSRGQVTGTTIVPRAFKKFGNILSDIVGDPKEAKIQKIQIVLLGDIFDVIRSSLWLRKDNQSENRPIRPWSEPGEVDASGWNVPQKSSKTLSIIPTTLRPWVTCGSVRANGPPRMSKWISPT
jgi:hypothetical protein